MSQEAYSKFRPTATFDALVLIDEDLVVPFLKDDPYRIPATRLAEELGHRLVANVVMLGFFSAVTRLVGSTAMQQAIQTSVKAKAVPLNLQAFAKGYEYVVAAAAVSARVS